MTVADVIRIMEQWAPPAIAWERDNIGLQIGNPGARIEKILVSLDVTPEIIAEAARKRAGLIIAHHPLFFRPPRSIVATDPVGGMALDLAKHDIAVFAAHTNLDFTRNGVSMALASSLGLQNVRFLSPMKGLLSKIVVFVPRPHTTTVMEAMAAAGAGGIGNYTHCSFQADGYGTFLGSEQSNPTVGKRGVLETTEETRLEMILPRSSAGAVITAMKAAHPYEEVAYDLIPLDNESPDAGMGAVGDLPRPVPLKRFLRDVQRSLKAPGLRFAGSRPTIRRVAVCGGSGSELIPAAMQAGADAFVTADIRYHAFHEGGDLVLVDAGHWETEQPILETIAARIRSAARDSGERIIVTVTRQRTSPIQFS